MDLRCDTGGSTTGGGYDAFCQGLAEVWPRFLCQGLEQGGVLVSIDELFHLEFSGCFNYVGALA